MHNANVENTKKQMWDTSPKSRNFVSKGKGGRNHFHRYGSGVVLTLEGERSFFSSEDCGEPREGYGVYST